MLRTISIALILLLLSATVFAEGMDYGISRSCSFQINQGINANFGEYRNWGSYIFHDGIDYRAAFKELYPQDIYSYLNNVLKGAIKCSRRY